MCMELLFPDERVLRYNLLFSLFHLLRDTNFYLRENAKKYLCVPYLSPANLTQLAYILGTKHPVLVIGVVVCILLLFVHFEQQKPLKGVFKPENISF